MGTVCSSRKSPVVKINGPEQSKQEAVLESTSSNVEQKSISQKPDKNKDLLKPNFVKDKETKETFQNEVQKESRKSVKKKDSLRPVVNSSPTKDVSSLTDGKPVVDKNKDDVNCKPDTNDEVLSDKDLYKIFSKNKPSKKSSKLTIIHFNDVYNIESRDIEPIGGAARFVTKIRSFENEPLILFSGDCLNPSLMSSVTKGSQMVPVLNAIGVSAAVYGNHDFDFGVDRLINFRNKTNFPWLLSNVFDKLTKTRLADGVQKVVADWHGHKIGIVGVVEEEWIVTLSTIDPGDIEYTDFVECARELVNDLRKNQGCEFIIALTHMRVPNDVRLLESDVDIDLILGGHDHHYETKQHNGKTFLKSGSDFGELTEITVEFTDTKRTIKTKRHEITGEIDEDEEMKAECAKFVSILGQKMDVVLGVMHSDLDGRFSVVRTQESNLGNFICDIMRAATQTDIALLNSGSLRSDVLHPAGPFKMKNLVNILPMVDSLVVLKMTGHIIMKALENSVSQYPKYEGRFLQVSGISFVYDPDKPSGTRICRDSVKVHDTIPLNLDQEYTVVTKQYLAKGKDGYDMLKDCEVIVDEENGPVLTTIVENHFESVQVLKGTKNSVSGHRQSLVVRHDENHSFMEEQRSKLSPKVEGRIRKVNDPAPDTSPSYIRRKSKLRVRKSTVQQEPNETIAEEEVVAIETIAEDEGVAIEEVVEEEKGDDSDIDEVMTEDKAMEEIEDGERMNLWEAFTIDDIDKVKSIINGRHLDFRFWHMEKTLIHHAAQHNSVKCLTYLLKESNLTINVRDQILKNTPLFYAAEYGCKQAAVILLDHNSRVNARNTLWETPLHLACEQSHGDVIILLLARGADRYSKDKDGATPKI